MEILNFKFCDYCGKQKDNLFEHSEKPDEGKPYEKFFICEKCFDLINKEIDDFLKEHCRKLSIAKAKNEKIKEILEAGFKAQIQNYINKQES